MARCAPPWDHGLLLHGSEGPIRGKTLPNFWGVCVLTLRLDLTAIAHRNSDKHARNLANRGRIGGPSWMSAANRASPSAKPCSSDCNLD